MVQHLDTQIGSDPTYAEVLDEIQAAEAAAPSVTSSNVNPGEVQNAAQDLIESGIETAIDSNQAAMSQITANMQNNTGNYNNSYESPTSLLDSQDATATMQDIGTHQET
jgi:carbohydrate-selective porin OprB